MCCTSMYLAIFLLTILVSLLLLVEPAAVFTVYFTIYIPIEGRQHPHKV